MTLLAIIMIAGGLAALTWGLPAMHRLRRPFDILASLIVLGGVICALLGSLLIAVPGFFQG